MSKNQLEDDHIVSSEHLADSETWQLSEFEYGLIMTFNAFTKWTLRCMNAAGYNDLGSLDVLVLHHVHHRGKAKRLADVAFALNVEDLHTVNYSLKKLLKMKLVTSEKKGKEVFYSTTRGGAKCCMAYKEIRERCLTDALRSLKIDSSELHQLGTMLRILSGLYDQASRAASSL